MERGELRDGESIILLPCGSGGRLKKGGRDPSFLNPIEGWILSPKVAIASILWREHVHLKSCIDASMQAFMQYRATDSDGIPSQVSEPTYPTYTNLA
jgi:hypothetical protein